MSYPILTGIRVIDLSFYLPGPYCSRILADMGAEVIKVERRLMGDPLRGVEPLRGGIGSRFLALNRNKKSLSLNWRRPEGRQIVLDLVPTADVFLEGFRPGRAAQLGFGYGALRELRPDIVYCSLSGYGQTGALADRAGHDLNYAALAGLLDLLPAGGPPAIPGVQFADLGGGLYAAIGILAALVRRGISGEGACLDVNMLEATVGLAGPSATTILAGEAEHESTSYLTGGLPAYNLYRTKDGRWMSLAAIEPVFWADFCRAIGRQGWASKHLPEGDERNKMVQELKELFASRTQDEWIAVFTGHDVCCEPVLSLEEAMARPELRERGLIFSLEQGSAGRTTQVALPIDWMADQACQPDKPAPLLGQHTVEIMAELGYTEDVIEQLLKRRVIAAREHSSS